MEPIDVLRRYIVWCENCGNTRQVEIHRFPDKPYKIVCRECKLQIEEEDEEIG